MRSRIAHVLPILLTAMVCQTWEPRVIAASGSSAQAGLHQARLSAGVRQFLLQSGQGLASSRTLHIIVTGPSSVTDRLEAEYGLSRIPPLNSGAVFSASASQIEGLSQDEFVTSLSEDASVQA